MIHTWVYCYVVSPVLVPITIIIHIKGVCVCIYIHIYTYIYIHTYIHTYIYIYIHTYIYTYIHIKGVCVCVYIYIHIYTYIYIYIHTYIYTHTHLYIYIYIWKIPSPKDPNPGLKPRSPTLQVDSLPAEPPGKLKNTRVGSLVLLQQVFLESKQGLLHCRRIFYQMSYQESNIHIYTYIYVCMY